MPASRDAIEAHLPVTPAVLDILIAVGEGPLHGYAVAQAVRSRSEGHIRLETGPLYRHLKRLLDDGLVEESPERPAESDARRGSHYRLTSLGLGVVAAETRRLGEVVALARRMGLAAEPGR